MANGPQVDKLVLAPPQELEQLLEHVMELHGLHHRVQGVPLPLGVHEGDAVPGAVQVLNVSPELGLLRVSNTSEKCGSKLPAGVHSRLGAINASLDVTELLHLGLNGFGLDCWRLLGGKGSLEVLEVAHDLLEFIPELLYQGESVPEIPHPLVTHGLDLAPEAGQLVQLLLGVLDRRVLLVGRLQGDVLRGLFNSLVGSLLLLEIINGGVVVIHLLLVLHRMGGGELGPGQLVLDILEEVEHPVELVSELRALVHGLLQRLHSLPEVGLEVVVSLVGSLPNVLGSVGVILDKVDALEQRSVLADVSLQTVDPGLLVLQ